MRLKYIILIAILIFILPTIATHAQTEPEIANIAIEFTGAPLTKQNVARAIAMLGIKHGGIVFRQSMLESGHLKSKLARNGNNLFGMKKNKRLWCLDKKLYGYATYSEWIYSVIDYYEWQKKRDVGADYFKYLKKRRYHTDGDNYARKLRGIKVNRTISDILINRGLI